MVKITIINDKQVERGLRVLGDAIHRQRRTLMTRLGSELKKDVKRRILTQDKGSWAKPGKWAKAKKDRRKSLVGTSKFIRSKSTKDRTEVFGAMPGTWTFTQHHRGFTKPPTGRRVRDAVR